MHFQASSVVLSLVKFVMKGLEVVEVKEAEVVIETLVDEAFDILSFILIVMLISHIL
jgi:hypothetical protein